MSKTTIVINTKTSEGQKVASQYNFLSKINMYLTSGLDNLQTPFRYSFIIETIDQTFVEFMLNLLAKQVNNLSDIISIECFDYESNKKIYIPNSLIKLIKLNQFSDQQLSMPINLTLDLIAENTFIIFEDIE